ncbi:MAG: DUF2336 domain-containing protein [Sneathiella sp.]|nr:DUF2336 domain-containing protein [Sneathiella sp.]
MSAQSQGNINQILNLVELAEDKSRTQRKFLYEKIGTFLIDDEKSFSTAEKELMADILCRITSDVEKSIRAHFSKNISGKSDIPKDLMVFLANDEIEVALPILRDSGILEETDLIKIIHTRSSQHQLAVAARENITESVSQALCDTNDAKICVCLLNNLTANVSVNMLEMLGLKSESIVVYQKPLLNRPFLPNHIAEKMYRWVSMSLREIIAENFDIDPQILEIHQNEREQTIRSISEKMDPSEMLVDKLFTAGELSVGFLLKSLRQGEVDLFEITFAKLLTLSRQQIQQILYTKDPQRLGVACKALKLDKVIFSTMLDLTLASNVSQIQLSPEEKEDVISFYCLLKIEAAKRALKDERFLSGEIKYYETN